MISCTPNDNGTPVHRLIDGVDNTEDENHMWLAPCRPYAQQYMLRIDFGSQVTQLIARRLRELNIYSEIHPFQKISNDFLKEMDPKAIILSGGPRSVTDKDAPLPPKSIFNMNIL